MDKIILQNALNSFKGKKVFITGHTGFKGSWLSYILNKVGAEVMGYALDPIDEPSHFNMLDLSSKIQHIVGDIRDAAKLDDAMHKFKPEFVFHLAAQALVKKSYDDPVNTFDTNIMGSVNLLDSVRRCSSVLSLVYITSDKCYENVEWIWGYKETDRLGGSDPYSASKAAAEISIKSYIDSFFPINGNIKISIGRAGNVIGGGDWSESRIIPDAIISWSKNKTLKIKNPNSTRPWQHVLEPLSGYITLAEKLKKNNSLHGEAFNFGPKSDQNFTVQKVIEEISKYWIGSDWSPVKNNQNKFYESSLLKLNCDKALYMLDWKSSLGFNETIKYTAEWYKAYFEKKVISEITERQIRDYSKNLSLK